MFWHIIWHPKRKTSAIKIMDLHALINYQNLSVISLAGLAARFMFNLFMAGILILLIYRRHTSNKEFSFTLFSFNLIIFALCTILNNVDLSIGSGFGLFAVFTMMRYRSEQLKIKDMTYLLILIGLGFVNATFSDSIGILEIAFLNISIAASMLILEKTLFNHHLSKQKIKYDDMELLKLENRSVLIKDLENKIGARVTNVHINSMNFQSEAANLIVTYDANKVLSTNNHFLTDHRNDIENRPSREKVFVEAK
jgi:hypothetical protein